MAEHGELGNTVGQDMMEHQDQRRLPAGPADRQGGRPQGTIPRQPVVNCSAA
jgi:hypothetical protein